MKKFKFLIFSLLISSFSLFNLSTATEQENVPPTSQASPYTEHRCANIADVIEPLMPAVVNVYTSQHVKSPGIQRMPFLEGFPFEQFNGLFEQFENRSNAEESYFSPKATSLGSGFIIDPSGFIVTNYHLIAEADEIRIKLSDNTELPAKLIGSDKKTDLALLKIEAKINLPFVKFGDSSKARIGDMIITIGNPYGLGGTVTHGIVSSKGRDINIDSDKVVDDFIQTDAPINRGNSGGPMFNMQGEVIGVNTAIYSPSGNNIGIGFAIPASTAELIIGQLMKNGRVDRGRLDVNIQPITAEIAEGLGVKEDEGVLIVEVIPGGSGDKAGLKSGDIVLEFNGQIIKTPRKLQISVAETPLNKEVKMIILRSGKKQDINLKILDNKKDVSTTQNNKDNELSGESFKRNGFTFNNSDPSIKQKFGIKENMGGVIITEVAREQKNSIVLKVGDMIVGANQQSIKNIKELKKVFDEAIAHKKQNIVLVVKRRDRNNIITFVSPMSLN